MISALKKKARAAVYGCGAASGKLRRELLDTRPDVAVVMHFESSEDAAGSCDGVPVKPISTIQEGDFDYLFVASAHYKAMLRNVPQTCLSKTLIYNDNPLSFPEKALAADGRVLVVFTQASVDFALNFVNLDWGDAFSSVYVDPPFTLKYLLQGSLCGRIPLPDATRPEDSDCIYIPDFSNQYAYAYILTTPFASLPILNRGMRPFYFNVISQLKEQFSTINAVEFGSVHSYSGGGLSTLGLAESLRPRDRLISINIEETDAAEFICSRYDNVTYAVASDDDFVDAIEKGTQYHLVCMQQAICFADSVFKCFQRIAPFIPEGGVILFAANYGYAFTEEQQAYIDEHGYRAASGDNTIALRKGMDFKPIPNALD